jgi:hypothetical protein
VQIIFLRRHIAADVPILHTDYSFGVLRDIRLMRHHYYRLSLPVELVEKLQYGIARLAV